MELVFNFFLHIDDIDIYNDTNIDSVNVLYV